MSLVLAIDATPLFDFHKRLKQHDSSAQGNIDYRAMLDALRSLSGDAAFDQMIAFASINREHEGQQKFCGFLRSLGFKVDETDYRDAFVMPRDAVSSHDRGSGPETQKYQRLSTRIAYLAGLLVQRNRDSQPHLVVVTDAFDVYYPLLDYVQCRRGQATIAFFRGGMEERWNRVGLFDDDSPVKFQDLSEHAEKIIGVDLSLSSGRSTSRDGLGSFEF